jgi:hypothetical protein
VGRHSPQPRADAGVVPGVRGNNLACIGNPIAGRKPALLWQRRFFALKEPLSSSSVVAGDSQTGLTKQVSPCTPRAAGGWVRGCNCYQEVTVSKRERIAQLEREVAELKREVAELKARPPQYIFGEVTRTDNDWTPWTIRQPWESYPTCQTGRMKISA